MKDQRDNSKKKEGERNGYEIKHCFFFIVEDLNSSNFLRSYTDFKVVLGLYCHLSFIIIRKVLAIRMGLTHHCTHINC